MKKYLSIGYDFAVIILGSLIFSLGIAGFIEPSEISPGGFSGVAIILNHVTGLPTGSLLFALNLPLILLGFLKLGGLMVLKTFLCTLVSSVAIDVIKIYLPIITEDKILSSLAGGLLIGVGMALVLSRGATSGGTDIAAKLIERKYPYFTLGRLILLMDALIITASAFVFGSIEASLYSVLAITLQTTVLDRILYGADSGKVAFLITNHPDEITTAIFRNLGRGVTHVPILGGYSGENKIMLMCALRRQQVGEFRRLVKRTDGDAFLMLTDAGEIIGNGFKM